MELQLLPIVLIVFLPLTLRSHCEYVEEFPVQALPHFSSISGHEISNHGVIVLVLQYGTRKIDFLGKDRAESDWTKAWKSNFLHPVLYYYDTLPTGEWKSGLEVCNLGARSLACRGQFSWRHTGHMSGHQGSRWKKRVLISGHFCAVNSNTSREIKTVL